MTFDDREIATILSALRYRQKLVAGDYPSFGILEHIATAGGEFKRLTIDEIDDLCFRINNKDAPPE